jgi:hypothetical protein
MTLILELDPLKLLVIVRNREKGRRGKKWEENSRLQKNRRNETDKVEKGRREEVL